MAKFTIETLTDQSTGHVLAEIRQDGARGILARSGPVYASHEEAAERILDTIAKAWPSAPVDPVYPANGS